jgi:hypothetical protein
MHNDIGRWRGVMMVARWEAEVEDIEVGGGNYCQIWVASRVEGSKEKMSKRFESGNQTLWSSFFVKTQKNKCVVWSRGSPEYGLGVYNEWSIFFRETLLKAKTIPLLA